MPHFSLQSRQVQLTTTSIGSVAGVQNAISFLFEIFQPTKCCRDGRPRTGTQVVFSQLHQKVLVVITNSCTAFRVKQPRVHASAQPVQSFVFRKTRKKFMAPFRFSLGEGRCQAHKLISCRARALVCAGRREQRQHSFSQTSNVCRPSTTPVSLQTAQATAHPHEDVVVNCSTLAKRLRNDSEFLTNRTTDRPRVANYVAELLWYVHSC